MPSGNKITTNFSNILFKQIKDNADAKSQQTIMADKVAFMILGNSFMNKRVNSSSLDRDGLTDVIVVPGTGP